MLFFDGKKFSALQTTNRNAGVGYAPRGTRLPVRYDTCVSSNASGSPKDGRSLQSWGQQSGLRGPVHVLGVLGVVEPSPMRSGELGDVGLVCFRMQDAKPKTNDIADFLVNEVAPKMCPYPEPRSILVLDNASEHRAAGRRIEAAVRARGAFLLWNPPNSPDLNAIEKFWDVALCAANHLSLDLAAGVHGPSRAFNEQDLATVLLTARVSRDTLVYGLLADN